MKLKLIENWNKFYKMWSVWFFAILAISPEIYTQLIALDLLTGIPFGFSLIVKILAILGIISRVVKQNELYSNMDNNKEL